MRSGLTAPLERPGTPWIPAIDGLRALAIAAVILFHLQPTLLPGGWTGVDLFFVLSGYLITRLLNRELQQTGQLDFAVFAFRRCVRIVPALFAMLAVYGLYIWFCTRHPDQLAPAIVIAAGFATNWARALGTAAEGPLGHTWTLATEQQFYLLWPVVLTAFGRRPVAGVAALLVAVVAWRAGLALGGASSERTYNGFDTHTDGLLAGALLALAPPGPALRRWALRWAALPLAFLAAVLATLSYKSPAAQAFGIAASVGAAAWVLVAALEPGRLSRALSIAPLRYAGRISYSLYLWHLPILMLGPRHVPPGWPGTAILLAVSIVTAAASYHLVERPFLALRMSSRVGANARPAAA